MTISYITSERCRRYLEVTYVWVLLQLVLDESEKVFLIHTSRVVNMGIDLSDVVEVTSESAFLPSWDLHSLPMRNSL